MKNRNYVVCRDSIYVGELIKTSGKYIYRHNDDIDEAQLSVNRWRSFRSMLFVPNENNLSDDLLYKTPSYPVLNITDDETCLSLEEDSMVIHDAYNLGDLLKYFKYEKYLSYEDIIKIRKTFFTGRFAKDNCQLFGYKETMAEDLTFYVNGKEVTDPKQLEKMRRKFRAKQKAGHRSFTGISESQLSSKYFDVLDKRGDNSLADVLSHWEEKMNAFTPHKLEGPVKKLTRF